MKLFRRKSQPDAAPTQIQGVAKVGSRTKALVSRLEPGDIAIIDHLDIDKIAAEALVAQHPAAILNAAQVISGRYPNLGPGVIVAAGIPLLDDLGSDVMTIKEGQLVTIDGNQVLVGGQVLCEGQVQSEQSVAEDLIAARAGLSTQLESFAANTMDFLQREKDLLLDGVGIPTLRTQIKGRQVLIVIRGYHYREDLAMLRSYIKEYRPILIGVDGGADAILDAKLTPDLIVGDMDSVSDEALNCGAEIVVHAYRDGRAPGKARLERLGIAHTVFPAAGTSEDIAMLVADDSGAELIVLVGSHATLEEFLDKGRAGMASTFLTRLRVGGKLVDAKGVSRLYRQRISNLQLVFLALAGLVALTAAIISTDAGRAFVGVGGAYWDDFYAWITNLSIFGGGS